MRTSLTLLVSVCVLTALLRSAPALANGRPPAPVSLSFSSDANRLLVGTTFGAIVSADAGASWRWICEPALQMLSGIDPVFVYLPNQDLMATSYDALLISHDDGCNWEAHDGFASVFPTDLETWAGDANALWLTSGQSDHSVLYASRDAGQSFVPVYSEDRRFFSSVAVAPSDANMLAMAATDSLSPPHAYLYESGDGGGTWNKTQLPFDQFSVVRVLAVHPTQPTTQFIAVTSAYNSTGALWRSDGDGSLTVALQAPDPLRNMAFSDDGQTVWAASSSVRYRSTDGGATFTLQAVPLGDACVKRRGGTLYTCGDYHYDDWSLASSTDGGIHWTPLLSLPNVQGPLQCPAGSTTQTFCPPLWGALAKSIGAAGASGPARPTLPGLAGVNGINNNCACRATQAGVPLAMLTAAWRAWRRRRQPL